jgi:tetraacyldisaccharide 4'-kinase
MSSDVSLLKAMLALPAAGYHAVQRIRAKAFEWGLLKARSAPIPVISVGNLLMGGSGKTPFVIALVGLLQGHGMKPAVVSRGYRGTNRKEFLVVGDGTGGSPLVEPSVCGDEPYLIAERLPNTPVLIGRRRLNPARAASKLFGCDVIVLDDGFQHLPLKRDVDIVLVNGSEDSMFPLGSLREPLSALARANVVVLVEIDSYQSVVNNMTNGVADPAGNPPVTGTEAGATYQESSGGAGVPAGHETTSQCHSHESALVSIPVPLSSYIKTAAVFRCKVVPVGFVGADSAEPDLASCAGKSVTLVSAIANPERFTKTVETLGCSVQEHVVFPDHHSLNDREIESLLSRVGNSRIIVTEKDWVKLPEWFKKREGVVALRIEMVLEDQKRFLGFLKSLVASELR